MSASLTRRRFAEGTAWLALGAAANAQGFAGLGERADGFARVTPGRTFAFPADPPAMSFSRKAAASAVSSTRSRLVRPS